jgi:hypothetical protein
MSMRWWKRTPSITEIGQNKTVEVIEKDILRCNIAMYNINSITVEKLQSSEHLGQYSLVPGRNHYKSLCDTSNQGQIGYHLDVPRSPRLAEVDCSSHARVFE